MTNMQHYMDDIEDLLDGLNEEMAKRLRKIEKWDDRIKEKSSELKKLQNLVFDETKSMKQRGDAAHQLTDLQDEIRVLAEKKVTLTERNDSTVKKVYEKLSELAYHCKCEVEIDNPGCTEQREREFNKSLDKRVMTFQSLMDALPGRSRKRESSVLTDDGTSTRSVTPFNGSKSATKKGPGRPRNQKSSKFKTAHFDRIPENSAVSSTRSSVDPEPRPDFAEKKLSKYMRKKQEKLRLEEEQRVASMLEVKKEVDSLDYEAYALNSSWGITDYHGPSSSNVIASSSNQAEASAACVDLCEEDERDLLDCLNFSGLPSPPKGMMEDMDVTESALYSMDMYPPGHKSSPEFRHPSVVSGSVAGRGTSSSAASSSQSYTQRSNNARLTNRVSEMIAANRKKNHSKKYRDQEEWCMCNGANMNSEMMVECENKDCPIEWFHFGCVGLDAPPQDEWYCPECRVLSAHVRPSQLHI